MRNALLALVLLLHPFCFSQEAVAADPSTANAATGRIRAELSRHEGQRARLRLRDNTEIKGRITGIAAAAVTLQPDRKSLPVRTIPLDQVASVSGAGLTRGQKWAVFGVAWLAFGAVGAALNH